jgi:dTDP-4-dehydrorhamnose reductase
MYDARREGMYTHNNFVTNIKEALRQGSALRFATREYRGITWVDEVVRNIPHTLQLPRGVYNFGAENRLNTYETARAYLNILKCSAPEQVAIADEERFATHIRNISISMKKATEASDGAIQFADTVEGLRRFEEFGY